MAFRMCRCLEIARHRPFTAHGWPLWFTVQGDGRQVKKYVLAAGVLNHFAIRAF